MSLKAKLEAVIYAAEEPVTLNQLAALFAAEALEFKAAQDEVAREQAVEAASLAVSPSDPMPLLAGELGYLNLAENPAVYTELTSREPLAGEESEPASEDASPEAPSVSEPEEGAAADNEHPAGQTEGSESAAEEPQPVIDIEAESRRLARQRDREIKGTLKQILDELVTESANDGRGVEIREIAGGYRMATKPECHDAVRMFVKSLKPALKLSLPALETLAVVAYKQPVTAPEVSEIRGVESAGVLGSLLARKLIATAGRKQVIGRPILYKTTKEFLLRFGLKDLTELPSMEEFEKMAGIEIEESSADPSAPPEPSEGELALLESNSPSGEELAETADIEPQPEAASEPSADDEPAADIQPADASAPTPAGQHTQTADQTAASGDDASEEAAGDPASELGAFETGAAEPGAADASAANQNEEDTQPGADPGHEAIEASQHGKENEEPS